MSKYLITAVLMVFFNSSIFGEEIFQVVSPDGKLKTEIFINDIIEYSVSHENDILLEKSPISMTLSNGITPGVNGNLVNVERTQVNKTINAFCYKKKLIKNNYNELIFYFEEGYNIIFRAYDDGIAYRFRTDFTTPFEVKSEEVMLNFPGKSKAYVPYVFDNNNIDTFEKQFFNSFESHYEHIELKDWNSKRLAFLPLLIEGKNHKKIAITEVDLFNYPGLYLSNQRASSSLQGVFAQFPDKIESRRGTVQSRKSFIAKYSTGKISFPWRVIIVAKNDHELANSDMVYKLATPNQIPDISWIKPGKVAWDHWCDRNVFGVDFVSGINNETYKYFIDFASDYKIEYILLDAGWYRKNLMDVVPDIDLRMLIDYGKSRNVDLILWAAYTDFEEEMEAVCKHYSSMGIKGFKIDFMDRDDQLMVEFHHRAAKVTAKHKLLLSFHGTYKPTGLQRTYPNVITYEGVSGLEWMKWALPGHDQVTYDVTIPFIRMIAGPMDYTSGAMRNASKENYYPFDNEPMSQGTRCRQLAQYIIFESPLSMLSDSPSNYLNEKECLEFIAKTPTTWDETLSLNGEVAKYITIARKKGDDWYIASMTNWDAREVELDLSFLKDGKYTAEVFKDGANADKAARDYIKEVIDIPTNKKIKIKMVQGGGYAMKISLK